MKQNKGFSGIVNIIDDTPKLKDVNELSGFSKFTQIPESTILGKTNINIPVPQNIEPFKTSSKVGLIMFIGIILFLLCRVLLS